MSSSTNPSHSHSSPLMPQLEINDVLLSHIFRVSSHGLRLFVSIPGSDSQSVILAQVCDQFLNEFRNLIFALNYRTKGQWLMVDMFFDDIRDAMEANTLLLSRWRLGSLKIKVEYICPAQSGPPSLRSLAAFPIPKKGEVTKYIELWRTQLESHFEDILGISAIPELTQSSKRHLDIWFYSIKSKQQFSRGLKSRKKGFLQHVGRQYSELRSRRELIVNRATFLPRHIEIYTSIKKFLILAVMIPHFNFDLSEHQPAKESRKLYREEEQKLPEICTTIEPAGYVMEIIILNPQTGSSVPRSSSLFHPPLTPIPNTVVERPEEQQIESKPKKNLKIQSIKQEVSQNKENLKFEEIKQSGYTRATGKGRYHVKNSQEQRGLFNPSYCPPRANQNFAIDLEAVKSGKDKRRTVMLKNIPNSLTQTDVMKLINERNFKGCYDYFYLPIDFKYHSNVGYAFVNLDSLDTVVRFVYEFKGMHWSMSPKVADVTYARTQGLKSLIQAAKNSQVGKTQNDPRLKPVILKLR